MYERILVPLDGSELAGSVLPYVRLMARAFRCRIELVGVMKPPPAEVSGPARGHLGKVEASMLGRVQDYLEGVAASLAREGLSASVATHGGDPAAHIVAEAEREPGTLIAMSAHGRSGITRWLLGSVTDKVLRAARAPLLVVRSRREGASLGEAQLRSLILPLDGSSVAEQVLPHAVAVAKALRLRVTLVRVTPSREEYHRYMGYHLDVSPGPTMARVYGRPYEEFSSTANAQAMEYLHDVGQRLRQEGLAHVEERLLHAHPAVAIVDAARDSPDALVAMTTHGRSGLRRWVLGSVTDRVISHADGPMLVVRAR